MEYRSSEVKAGFFIFVSLVGLIVMIFMLGDIQDYFKPRRILRIVFNFTGGMEVGAPVRYAGLDIGSVKDIELLGDDKGGEKGHDRVAVMAEINPKITIKKDSIAMIKTSGLMGGLYIDVRPGTKGSPPLGPNEELVGEDTFEIAKIGDMATEIVLEIRKFTQLSQALVSDARSTLKDVRTSLANVDAILKENRKYVRANMENALDISEKVSDMLDKNSGKVQSTLNHVASFSERTDKLLAEKDTEIREVISQMHNLTREMEILLADTRPGVTSLINSMEANAQQITTDIDRTATSVEQTLGQGNSIMMENRRNLLLLLQNMNETSRNLKSLTDDLKRNPWKLIRKSDEVARPPAEATAPGQPDIRMQRLDKVK
ncbi:MAG: MCE family protein [Nitrospinae bacterium]|nr:MCE family protein [Nitrospinota bacterium]